MLKHVYYYPHVHKESPTGQLELADVFLVYPQADFFVLFFTFQESMCPILMWFRWIKDLDLQICLNIKELF